MAVAVKSVLVLVLVLVLGDVLGGGLLQLHHSGLAELVPVHR